MGCGFAGGFAGAGLEGGGEWLGVLGVVCGGVPEGLEGDGFGGCGDAAGLEFGLCGESVEEVVERG